MNLLISHFLSSKLGKFLILSRSPAGMYTEPLLESSAGSISGRARKCGQIHSICSEKDWSTYFYAVKRNCRAVEFGDLRPTQLIGNANFTLTAPIFAILASLFEPLPSNLLSSPFAAISVSGKSPAAHWVVLVEWVIVIDSDSPTFGVFGARGRNFAVLALATRIRDAWGPVAGTLRFSL